MEIKLQVDDLELFTKALNNALISYNETIWAVTLGCEVPSKLEPLKKISDYELIRRRNCLANVYEQVEKIEKMTISKT